MNITIKATNYVLTADSQGFIEKKFGLLRRFVKEGEVASIGIEAESMPLTEKDGARYRVEANLVIDGKLYRAEARSATLEAAVEKVRHELEDEVRSASGRARKLWKRGASAIKGALRGWR